MKRKPNNRGKKNRQRRTNGANKREKEHKDRVERRSKARNQNITRHHRSDIKSSDEPVVSDHAMVRYLQRVIGFDVKAAQEIILTPEVREHIRLGATSFTVDGISYKASNNILITCFKSNR